MYMSLEQGLIEEWAYNVLGVEVLLCLHYELSLGRKSHQQKLQELIQLEFHRTHTLCTLSTVTYRLYYL